MLEVELQNYLYDNPSVLFPNQIVDEKHREFTVDGKRVDLLFHVEGFRYIIELKRETIKRQDVGQVLEYYGRMRRRGTLNDLRMMLVAPSIPSYWTVALEEFGIRCIEVPYPFLPDVQLTKVSVALRRQDTKQLQEQELLSQLSINAAAAFADLAPPVGMRSMAFAHMFLRDSLDFVIRNFEDYQVVPVKMTSSTSPDVLCFGFDDQNLAPRFSGGGPWWAYAIGESEQMPKNNLPNLSVIGMPWGLDITVNSELLPSQRIVRRKLASDPVGFDRITSSVGQLRFQAWLKLEHQPRFYHWIPLALFSPETWDADRVSKFFMNTEKDFKGIRERAIAWLREVRPELSANQVTHMERMNQSPNIAIRFADKFGKDSKLWDSSWQQQIALLNNSYLKLKPIIDFLHKK